LHLNNIPTFGISGLIRPFSPDVARSMHFTAPLGLHEGIAVFHESHYQYTQSGRGNHPYFTNRYASIFNSSDPLRLSQVLSGSSYTYPFERHYMGGYSFIHWLQYEYGMDITKNTIEFLSRWPYLGYGAALRYHTGKWPGSLYQQYASHKRDLYHSRFDPLTHIYEPVFENRSEIHRRPVWLNNHTILYHASGYQTRPGFYLFDVNKNLISPFIETTSVEDFIIDTDSESGILFYSRYHRHLYYHNHFRMRIHKVMFDHDFNIRSSDRFFGNKDRIHAPAVFSDDCVLALQNHSENNILVKVCDASLDTLLIPETGYLVQVFMKPGSDTELSMLANRNGHQGIWFISLDELNTFDTSNPDIMMSDGSIYDTHWHKNGRILLFSSDMNGAMNLYEYHSNNNRVYQLTDHRYGIMEGSFSPCGSKISAVQINENRIEL
ncbi:hypothetical protein QLX67_13715, partial [Balneolaceae bacterium ANBcel3]|nr:hypothetical protein [Balneolaceae bacterium ANBcel3]